MGFIQFYTDYLSESTRLPERKINKGGWSYLLTEQKLGIALNLFPDATKEI